MVLLCRYVMNKSSPRRVKRKVGDDLDHDRLYRIGHGSACTGELPQEHDHLVWVLFA
jgi:hypothetical protein